MHRQFLHERPYDSAKDALGVSKIQTSLIPLMRLMMASKIVGVPLHPTFLLILEG